MLTLEHAFNAKDMNSLVVKIIREEVWMELRNFSTKNICFLFDLDTTNIEKI